MNSLVSYAHSSLPQIPLEVSLDGKNLDTKALLLNSGQRNAEQAVSKFLARNTPEHLPYYRRYYLKPHMRGGAFAGRYSIRYAWNLRNPSSDLTVGVLKSDDLSAAKVMIGNNMAGAYMTPIRWELCEDRDGEEPISLGRFDPWSLLQDVSHGDLERLRSQNLVPNIERWDFDHMFIGRTCPSCGSDVSVNIIAYNIDSAKCRVCGIHPFLSFSLGQSLTLALPSVTGEGMQMECSDYALLHAIQWMGGVKASVRNLHQEELPEGVTPHDALKQLLRNSRLMVSSDQNGIQLHPSVLEKFSSAPDGHNVIVAAHSAANTLAQAIESGSAFTPVHAAMASMLKAIQDQKE